MDEKLKEQIIKTKNIPQIEHNPNSS